MAPTKRSDGHSAGRGETWAQEADSAVRPKGLRHADGPIRRSSGVQLKTQWVIVVDDFLRGKAVADALQAEGYRAEVVRQETWLERDPGHSAYVVVACGAAGALEACRRIRAQLGATTILVFAAEVAPAAALLAGADLYCSSVWSTKAIALQLRAIHDRDRRPSDGLSLSGDALLRSRLESVCLTHAEGRLIDCLWRYANDAEWHGKPLPYAAIASEAGFQHDVDPQKTIRTHAGNIRKKLRYRFGDDAQCLRTRHGVGLWLDVD